MIATVAALEIYPVKSMAGISVKEACVSLDGIVGDRQYSFVRGDVAAKSSFPWLTARQCAQMLRYQPTFEQLPTFEEPEPALTVRSPGGEIYHVSDEGLASEMAQAYGSPAFLLRSGRGIFDCQHVSLFSNVTGVGLAGESGVVALDAKRFRANVYIEPASGKAFDEEGWVGFVLQIGADVLVGATVRDSRCMMVNLDAATGVQDTRVLRTIVERHDRQAGLYANVIRPGRIRVGDEISVVSEV